MNPYENNIQKKKDTAMGSTDKVSERIQKSKRFITDYLNDKVNRLSSFHKRVSLVMFGFMMGTICLSIIIQSIRINNESSFSLERITLPKDIHDERFATQQLDRTFRLKNLLDSLRQTKSKAFDSLIRQRPGLVDSVNLFLQNYYSH